jgi:hypothetical protein
MGNEKSLREQFDELGAIFYGAQWALVARHNVERITSGKFTSADDLTNDQMRRLVDGMHKLQSKIRRANNGL